MSTGKVSPYPNPVEQSSSNVHHSDNSSNPESASAVTNAFFTHSVATATVTPSVPQSVEVVEVDPIKIYYPRKHLCEAYVLWFPLGLLGAHHFYLRRYQFGFLYVFTLGLCGIGWIMDLFRMKKLVRDANNKMEHPEVDYPLEIIDVYCMWFPFGIFGLHHFYMGRVNWGVMYSWTSGLYGIGWLVDAVRIPSLVRQANIDLPAIRLREAQPQNADLTTAYLLGLTPVGIFGTHHIYMGQWRYGLFYMYTLGGAGIGWIVDWFRMRWLVKRVNDPDQFPLGHKQKHTDSAYVCAFPFGLLGAHHFYLGNNTMGTVYFFTLGMFGIGWLIDLVRMHWLVKAANERLLREQELIASIRQRQGIGPNVIVPTRAQTIPRTNMPFDGQQTNIEMNETPILQPPSYSEAIAQSSSASTFQPYPQPELLGPMGAEGGTKEGEAPPISEKETKL